MMEMNQPRKNKVHLQDYDFHQDINNRLVMAQFSTSDLAVLEEILYSSIKIPVRKLAKSTDLEEEEILPILEKLSKTGLFVFDDDSIVVDKEMRKYFEFQILKFDPDFHPGMDFLQGLLRKVPIHSLPIWYSISRTSNNIFDSLIEKYLLTPQIFQRHLLEINFQDPVLTEMMKSVYEAKNFELSGKELMEKYKLTREQFEENLLHLEFSFVCCLGYKKVEDHWEEIVTPFHEWREYLTFLKNTQTKPILSKEKIKRLRSQDFSFIQDLSAILALAKKQPLPLETSLDGKLSFSKASLAALVQKWEGLDAQDPTLPAYLHRLISKLRMLKLADIVDGRLYALEGANDWLDMKLDNRAIFMYRHPLNRLLSDDIPPHLLTDRNVREAEKSIVRVLDTGWVTFDNFISGVIVPLGEESNVILKRHGKTWRYSLPSYTDEDLALIKATVFNWLFELGITAVGTHEGRDCFCVTPFGQSFFAK
jgi:hypothetical protein